jgi:hypothetical protein
MRIRSVLPVLLAGVLLGCAPQYAYQPDAFGQTATLQVERKMQFVYLLDDPKALKRSMNQDHVTAIPVGKRFWVESGFSYINQGGAFECVAKLSFVPELRKHYLLVFRDGGRRCFGTVMQRGSEGELMVVPTIIYDESTPPWRGYKVGAADNAGAGRA